MRDHNPGNIPGSWRGKLLGGNAHAHALFDLVRIKRNDGVEVPRHFSDYEVSVEEASVPAGVRLIRRI